MPIGLSELGKEVQDRRDSRGLTQKAFAVILDRAGQKYGWACSAAAVKRMESNNIFSSGSLRALAEVLELGDGTLEWIERRFKVTKWTRWHPPASDKESMAGQIESAEKAVAAAMIHLSKAGASTQAMFSKMGDGHYFVSSTTTEMLMVLQPDKNPEFVEWRAAAIARGCLFGMIMPDEALCDRLTRIHRIKGAESHEKFTSRFEAFRHDMIRRIKRQKRGIKEAEAEKLVYTRMQRFECGEFPFTPAGWTVSLFGEGRNRNKAPYRRVIVRGPFPDQNALLIWPEAFHFEVSMHEFIIRVLEAREDEIRRKENLPDRAVLLDHEKSFIDALQRRMNDK